MSRVVLVTGGTRGLGLGISAAFVAAGDTVVVCGRNPHDGPGRFVQCDVRDPAEVDALIASIMSVEGRLDVVVNNAGGSPSALVSSSSARFAERIVALNLLAPLYVARAARAVMTTGVILNIGSVAAVRPAPGTAAYAAAKAGLTVLTRALALEWAPDVRVNQITVGLLETESSEHTYGDGVAVSATVPMGRMALPADVAAACVMLASPELSYVTGADLFVDGGGEIPAFHTALGETHA
ncbi:MAG: Short chain dehydrogenase [Frankiales bacterium]|nr:Short chain dehydrogenase [Frankiales bacterium]